MGYQVDRICYETKAEATNVLMTQVVPTIDKDGVLTHAVFHGSAWIYRGEVVDLTFPTCEFGEYFGLGQSIGQSIMFVFIGLLAIIAVLEIIKTAREKNE